MTIENCPSATIFLGGRRTFYYRFLFEISKSGAGNCRGVDFSAPRTTRGDCLVFLVDQVAIPAAQRRPTIIRATTEALLRVLGVAADLMQVWSTVGGPIRLALGL